MTSRENLLARWAHQVPGLDGDWDHWWLEGDGGLILVTGDLAELLSAVEAHYRKSLRLVVSRARHSPEGDSIQERGYNYVIADVLNDTYGWHN